MHIVGKALVIFLYCCTCEIALRASNCCDQDVAELSTVTLFVNHQDANPGFISLDTLPESSNGTRWMAVSLNIALGLFGLHRVFLGTDLIVPIFYTFTLGGGGILWLADLAMLIFSKDITDYINNPRLVMFFNTKSQQNLPDY